ncbi:hypothetical protein DLJ53_18090 [Acuticoccus sediminis]|uniref:GcrA cell cycle regulator n=1 Tax=Acuticoccus sediminis TaxID=2184697 RepID=A0A8B2NN86_9HYPH|nr:GcrA family cell cycle regulator [Acuticoccus sediminis]RAI01127.1 hypothetical protein DLJ53_18090 [Acuticoccus sediminis]
MNAPTNVNWTLLTPSEKTEIVKKGIRQGLSASKIAEPLGISRNAIIGVANRAGLSFGLKFVHRAGRVQKVARAAAGQAKAAPQKAVVAQKVPPIPKVTPAPPLQKIEPAPVVASDPVPMTSGVAFMDLSHRSCRAPLWGQYPPVSIDDFRFCGAKTIEEGSYCAEHHKRFHQAIHSTRIKPPSETRGVSKTAVMDAVLSAVGSRRW